MSADLLELVPPVIDHSALEAAAEQLELSTELYRVAFEENPDAIVVVNGSGRIALINKQAEILTGHHRTQLRGKPIHVLLPDDLQSTHVSRVAGFVDDPHIRPMGVDLDLRLRRRDGTLVAVEIMLAPAPIPQGVYVIATIRRRRDS